jgi:7-cyano-7-deazaguanine synthase
MGRRLRLPGVLPLRSEAPDRDRVCARCPGTVRGAQPAADDRDPLPQDAAQRLEVEAKAGAESPNQFAADHGLPSTFVPGRNMLFLAHAAAYGAMHGIYDLVTGVCEADAAGYPDCRASFVHRATQALSEALDDAVRIHAPLLHLNKAETWRLADDLGVLEIIRVMTHTCYNGIHDDLHLHEWGYGCGNCPSCSERSNGYNEYLGAAA